MANKTVIMLALAGIAVSSSPLPLSAAEPASCAARERVLSHLQQTYREEPASMGLANNGGVIEVLRSQDRASFTIIITMPNGMSCMIAAGESWEDLPKALARGPRI